MSISTEPTEPTEPTDPTDPPSARRRPTYHDNEPAARRVLLLFAVSLIVVGLGGLVAITFGPDDPTSARQGSGPASESSNEVDPSVEGIGPVPGEEVAAYTAGRAQALATAKGDRVAVVSFNRYMTEGEARAVVGQLAVSHLLAAAPAGTPSVVTGSMVDWVNGQVGANRSERDEIQKLLPTVDDRQFKAFYQDEVNRLTKLIDSVKPEGPHVFAVAVKGPTAALQALAQAPDVRLVDVGPSSKLPAGTPLRGLRPEEKEKANDPTMRPE